MKPWGLKTEETWFGKMRSAFLDLLSSHVPSLMSIPDAVVKMACAEVKQHGAKTFEPKRKSNSVSGQLAKINKRIRLPGQ